MVEFLQSAKLGLSMDGASLQGLVDEARRLFSWGSKADKAIFALLNNAVHVTTGVVASGSAPIRVRMLNILHGWCRKV